MGAMFGLLFAASDFNVETANCDNFLSFSGVWCEMTHPIRCLQRALGFR